MKAQEYIELIKETYEEIINEFRTSQDKERFKKILLELLEKIGNAKDEDYDTIFKLLTEDYLKSVEAIAKLSPGLSTGLYDETYGITLNTYNGKASDIPNDNDITEDTALFFLRN